MPMTVQFRLSDNADPEERLEEAALWKAIHDEYGDEAVAIRNEGDPDLPTFGRSLARRMEPHGRNPVSENLPYWRDPAFLEHTHRFFRVCTFDEAKSEVSKLHVSGRGAFLKSVRHKHAIFNIPAGTTFLEAMGDMAYSFIDGGPQLMVQELVEVRYEHRFFVIDRTVVTESPVQWALTPLDFPLPSGTVFATPNSTLAEMKPDIADALRAVAKDIASKMEYPHAAVDCGLIDGEPGAIELNPMCLGQVGLYAADVRALARASKDLLRDFVAQPNPVM